MLFTNFIQTQAGLTITAFDVYHYARGEFIDSANGCAAAILENHGETCETYKTASAYLKEYDTLYKVDEFGDVDSEDIDDEFLKAILEDYRIILKHELEYTESNEYIDEILIINEYEFDIDGNRA